MEKKTTTKDKSVGSGQVGPSEAPVAAIHDARSAPPVVVQAGNFAYGKGFSLTQRVLVLSAVGLALFSVYETYSKQPQELPIAAQESFDAVHVRGMPIGVTLAQTIDRFEQRRIIGPPPATQPVDPDDEMPVRGWRAEVRENWDLKGTSATPEGALEAIVFDNRAQRLQFLRSGETVQIAEQQIEVSRVDAERVELRRGDEVLVLD